MAVNILSATCQSASGSVTDGTTSVTRCYFQGADGTQYAAATINNDDPLPTQWNATDFAAKPTPATYTLFAMGNTDPPLHPSGEADGIVCA
jgi:hypothetical protein